MKRKSALLLAFVMLVALLPLASPALAEDDPASIVFPTAPAGDPYEGLPLFDGVPEHVDTYLDVFIDYIGLDGFVRFALDQRGDYQLRGSATYSNSYSVTSLRGKTVTWDQPNAGKRIPGGTRFTDSVMGVSTDFPAVMGMGQTWNKQLVYDSGVVLGNEALNRNQYYSNLTSTTNSYLSAFNGMAATALTDTRMNPLSGRIDESYSEDPYLVGAMSTAMGHGTGGTDLPESAGGFWQKVFVTTKHFTNYVAQWERRDGDMFASARSLMEYQSRGALTGFANGAFGGVLTTYGRINGLPDTVSPMIKYAKDLSPYNFYTVPDNGAENRFHVANTYGNGYLDRFTPEWSDEFLWMSYAEAAGALCNTTNNLPAINDEMIRMIDDIQNGKYGIEANDLYSAATGQILQLIRCGVLNERDANGMPKNYPFADLIYQNTVAGTSGGTHNHNVQLYRDIALNSALESVVLLKNNGVLPLSKTADIVITGGLADNRYKPLYAATTQAGPNYGLSPLGGIAAVLNATTTSADTRSAVAQFKTDGTYVSGGKIIRIKANNGKYLRVNDAGSAVTATADTAADATLFEVYAWGQADAASMRVVGETGTRASLNGRWLTNAATVNTAAAGNFEVSAMTSGFASATSPAGAMLREYQPDGRVRYVSGGIGSGYFDSEYNYYNAGRYMNLSDPSAGTLAQTSAALGAGTYSGVGAPELNAQAKRTEDTLFTEEVVYEAGEVVTDGEYAIVVIGNACRYSSGEGVDRVDLDLGREQYELAANVAANYPGKTIVVLKTSEPVIMKQIQNDPNVAAVIFQPYAGQYDGLGLAQVLFGDATPTGRMTNTWYASMDALPEIDAYVAGQGVAKNVGSTGLRQMAVGDNFSPYWTVNMITGDPAEAKLTYMNTDAEVTYPFGYGLGYSTFAYSNFVAPAVINSAVSFTVSVDVTNTGTVDTAEVVQLYITNNDKPYGDYTARRQLVSFEKAFVKAGETVTVTLTVEPKDFAVWNTVANDYTVLSGSYSLAVGQSSANIKFTSPLTVSAKDMGIQNLSEPINVYAASFATSNMIYREISRQGSLDALKANQHIDSFWAVMSKEAGAWTAMKNVDLSDNSKLTLSVATNKEAGNIEIRVDAVDGPVLATASVPVTDPVTYEMRDSAGASGIPVSVTELGYVDVTVSYDATGIHDLYLVFDKADLRVAPLSAPIVFSTAPAGDPYEGLPLFDGVPEHVDAYLDAYLDYIGLDGMIKYALDQRGDYQLRSSATFPTGYEITSLRGLSFTWDQPNAGKRIPGCALFYEGVQGVSTNFPALTGMGQTWNKELVNQIGSVIGKEKLNTINYNATSGQNRYMSALNFGVCTITDVRNNPLSGRIDESYSEDPYLASMMVLSNTSGITGINESNNEDGFWTRCFTDGKHFSSYTAQWMRTTGSFYTSARALTEYQAKSTYKAFAAGSLTAIMTSYGRTNSTPNGSSPMINYVKSISKYGIYTLSDNGAETSMYANNRYGNGYETRYTVSRNDQLLWQNIANNSGGHQQDTTYPAIHDNHIGVIYSVLQGKYGVTYDELARIAKDQIMTLIRNGILNERDPVTNMPLNYPFISGASGQGQTVNSTVQAHQEVALAASQECTVLLKNDGLLPLDKTAPLAVVGPAANTRWATTYAGTTPNVTNGGLTPVGGIAALTGKTAASLGWSSASSGASGKIVAIKASNGKYLSVNTSNWNVTATADTIAEATKFEVFAWGQAESVSLRYAGVSGTDTTVRWLTNAATVACSTTTAITGTSPPSVLIREDAGDGKVRFVSNAFSSGFGGGFETAYYSSGRFIQLSNETAGTLAQTGTLSNVTNANSLRNASTAFEIVTVKEAGADVTLTPDGIAIVVLGVSPRFSQGEGSDRVDLYLGAEQYELAQNIAAEYPGQTVVVIKTSAPVSVESLAKDDNISAIVYQPYGGQYDGLALAQILFGDAAPTGRLTYSWYASMDALPKITPYVIGEGVPTSFEGIGPQFSVEYNDADPAHAKLTYRYSDAEITYPFGHGLSYSTFAYSNFIAPAAVNGAGPFTVKVDVTNTGAVATADVVQLYITNNDKIYGVATPKKQLISFEKVWLNVGETKTVTLIVDPEDVAFWNTVANDFSVISGNYTLALGESSENIKFTAPLTVNAKALGILDPATPIDAFASSFAASNVVYREVSRQGTMDSLRAGNVTTNYWSVMSKQAGAWTAMKNVALTGYGKLILSVATNKEAGSITIHLDAPDGPALATVPVPVTNPTTYDLRDSDAGDFTAVSVTELAYTDVEASFRADGVHDLYLVFDRADLRVASLSADIDKSALADAISQFEALSKSDWTAESWADAEPVYTAALDVYGDQGALQAKIDAATDALVAAIGALEEAVLDFGAGQPAALTLKRGQVYQIKISSNNKDEVLFFSANGNVSLSSTGLVTGVKPGIAIITVVDTWSGQFFNIVINVTN